MTLHAYSKSRSEVEEKIRAVKNECVLLIEEIIALNEKETQNLHGEISFRYESSAPMPDLLTPFERAQSICFIARYECLPEMGTIGIIEKDERFYLSDMPFLRHFLNEYRLIVMNENDSVYYAQIHNLCSKMANTDPKKGLCLRVEHEKHGDITEQFIAILKGRKKSIKAIMDKSEFDYIYNGILQHSDHEHTKRFLEDLHSGRINYLFLKHAFFLEHIKESLFWHYKILHSLTFPKLGPL